MKPPAPVTQMVWPEPDDVAVVAAAGMVVSIEIMRKQRRKQGKQRKVYMCEGVGEEEREIIG